ncbi:hypothetical protein HMJ29_17555 [Hymenobacter taeanensis]|uniref:Uncharacterized protein n=1 Tax=Hymenobacter taeanensis TaxID=2735321 RepID=A0A6M6BKJ4_9BACT|nr:MULTISPECIES: hypothetical protein [Hymenobacter]QJX48626.1 hypothetical protein HMJ29_17555 [Hymenobacter taeanensis]UOQ81874.1 hypothetical protein MUN83_03535 [Hymenobacter sp. 5414T-23]
MLVAANTLLGHYAAPFGILLTPIVVLILTGTLLPLYATYSMSLQRVLWLALLICAHDVGTKLFAGGAHDAEGQGLVHALLFMGVLPAYGYILYQATHHKEWPLRTRVGMALLFPAVLSVYLYFFAGLGYEFLNPYSLGYLL